MPVAVIVTTLMAATLFMDTASARLAGQVSIEGSRPQSHSRIGGYILQEMYPEEPLWKWRGLARLILPFFSHRYPLSPALSRGLLGSQL